MCIFEQFTKDLLGSGCHSCEPDLFFNGSPHDAYVHPQLQVHLKTPSYMTAKGFRESARDSGKRTKTTK